MAKQVTTRDELDAIASAPTMRWALNREIEVLEEQGWNKADLQYVLHGVLLNLLWKYR